ncbi:MAG: hypothetical protein ABI689_02945 [Thermoanaerobaculia bacterium]
MALALSGWNPAAAVSPPVLVQNLARTIRPDAGSSPHGFAPFAGRVVFAAQPDDHADRLFVTDGSAAGTHALAATCAARVPGTIQLLFHGRDRAYYLSSCQDGFSAIWGTDGSSAATRLLTVLAQAGSGEVPDLGGSLSGLSTWVELGNASYFLRGGRLGPLELWKTDGTSEGTNLIRVLDESSSETYAGLSATSRGRLVIAAYSSLPWDDLQILFWESDGTAAGTTLGRRLSTTAAGFTYPVFARSDAGVLVWKGENNSSSELWFSDGTDAGTVELAIFHAGYSWLDAIGGLKADGHSVYFIASSDGQRSLWRSDLTPATTRPIMDVSDWNVETSNLVVLEDRLVFLQCANSNSGGCELWWVPKAGGTGEPLPGGCGSGPCDPIDRLGSLAQIGGRVLFRTSTTQRVSLWASSGTSAPPIELARLCEGDDCSSLCFQRLGSAEDYIFATSQSCEPPFDLWVSDGEGEGTFRLATALDELALWLASPGPLLAPVGESGWVFRASGGGLGLELWRADRRADSAAVLTDLRRDRPGLAAARELGEVAGAHLFAILGDQGRTSVVLRSPDGRVVEELFSLPALYEDSPEMQRLRFYATGEDWLFFAGSPHADPATYGAAYQLYRFRPATHELTALFEEPDESGFGASLSDGLFATHDGYLLLGSTRANPAPSIYRWRPGSPAVEWVMSLPASRAASAGSNLGKWFVVEEALRLVAIDLETLQRQILVDSPEPYYLNLFALEFGTVALIQTSTSAAGSVLQLWQTDGSKAGTVLVTQIPWEERFWCSSGFGVSPGFAQSAALFELDENCGGTQHLWTSDGSRERTRLLFADSGWYPDVVTSARFRGEHFFPVVELDTGANRYRTALWRSDGTAEGTRRALWLPDLSSAATYFPFELVAGASALYFPWADADRGVELWRSDGTAEETLPVADLEPGAASSTPAGLLAVGDQVLFSATTTATGTELWQVDGGSNLPQPVADLYPGPESSAPQWVSGKRESALFLADDGVVGRELWEVDRPSVAPCVADATTLCLADGRFRARAVRRDFAGELGTAGAVPLTGDSGYFWFFAPGNPEVLLKVVDACGLPGFGNFWAYSTGLTNVEVELEVVDSIAGTRKLVRTALGEAYGPLYDSGSFQVCASGGASAPGSGAPAQGSAATTAELPLLDGRFVATATWTKRDGTFGVAAAVPLARDSGYFWFFGPSVVEVLVKMVDACGYDGFDNFWVFAGGLTDVEVHLTVTDNWTGAVVRQDSLQGQPFSTLLETGKLRVCAAPQPAQ